MHFALLGEHPDGLELARALAESNRHQVTLYAGLPEGAAYLRGHGIHARSIGDVEELIADPTIDCVIVASALAQRRRHLVRALQSELHVLCVHPADISPDVAYEASLIQSDTGRVLLPMLPMALHPGIARLRAVAPAPRVVEVEIWSTENVVLEWAPANHKPGLPAWDLLRAIGGEIVEIYLQSTKADLAPDEPLALSGRFAGGPLLQASLLPQQAHAHFQIGLVTSTGRACLEFIEGWPGPARLTYADEQGQSRTETWDPMNPWPALIERFESAVLAASVTKAQPGQGPDESIARSPPTLGWQDELRALELDDAARRSLERGKSSTLDLQEVTEEASFKGTMTLVGCSMIWLAVVVLILSFWVPMLAWGIVPVFGIFLIMQMLRWVLPEKEPQRSADDS